MPRDSKNNRHKRKLTREFLLKEDKQLGKRKHTAYILASFRNIFYNTLDKKKELTVLELSVILWAYPYVFFSKRALRERLQMGKNSAPTIVEDLIKTGYIEKYSKAFNITTDREVYSELMGYSYNEEYEKRIDARYRLTRKGTQLVNGIVDEINKTLVISDSAENDTESAVNILFMAHKNK